MDVHHKSQNEEGEDMLSKANAKIELFWPVYSEPSVFSFTDRPFVCLFALSVFSFCVDVSSEKSLKFPHQFGTTILKYAFEAVIITFPVKKCEYVKQ